VNNKKRILLVDDEESITRSLKLFLDGTGQYEVRTENRGSLAVQVAREFRPDLIVLDLVMPDADGGSIAQDLGDDAELRDVPIVFLTAIVKEEEIGSQGRHMSSGHTLLAKPVGPKVLISHIEERLVEKVVQ